MKKAPIKKRGVWQTPRLHYFIKRSFKRKFGVKITSAEIGKIWSDYVAEDIIKPLSAGAIVKLDRKNKVKMWVKATPITEHKRAMALLKKGLTYSPSHRGVIEANLNLDTSRYIYDIVYENENYKGGFKLYYKPHPTISKAVANNIKQGKIITRFNVN